jgi:hypothetical protein
MEKINLFRLIVTTGVLYICYFTGWAQSNQSSSSKYIKADVPKQDSRSSLVFSGSLMHQIGKQNELVTSDANGIHDYYSFPLNPGLGIFYQYQISNKNYILSGVNYQWCHIATTELFIVRFRYSELSIPVYIKHYFLKTEEIGLYSSLGLSFGRMKLQACESHGRNYEWGNLDTKYLPNYSDKNSFADLIFNTGVLLPKSHIEIEPAIGYRMKDNWMGFYRHRFFYGLSINYQLKFSKK